MNLILKTKEEVEVAQMVQVLCKEHKEEFQRILRIMNKKKEN